MNFATFEGDCVLLSLSHWGLFDGSPWWSVSIKTFYR
jgi:hypothetical protein